MVRIKIKFFEKVSDTIALFFFNVMIFLRFDKLVPIMENIFSSTEVKNDRRNNRNKKKT